MLKAQIPQATAFGMTCCDAERRNFHSTLSVERVLEPLPYRESTVPTTIGTTLVTFFPLSGSITSRWQM